MKNSIGNCLKNILPLKDIQMYQIQYSLEQVELFSIQDVCQILTKQNQLSVTCEQSPSLIKFSAAKGL